MTPVLWYLKNSYHKKNMNRYNAQHYDGPCWETKYYIADLESFPFMSPICFCTSVFKFTWLQTPGWSVRLSPNSITTTGGKKSATVTALLTVLRTVVLVEFAPWWAFSPGYTSKTASYKDTEVFFFFFFTCLQTLQLLLCKRRRLPIPTSS